MKTGALLAVGMVAALESVQIDFRHLEDHAGRVLAQGLENSLVEPRELARGGLSALPGPARAELVRKSVAHLKAWFPSDAAKADWAKRKHLTPPPSPQQQLAELDASDAKMKEGMAKAMAEMPPEMKPELEQAMKQQQQMIDDRRKELTEKRAEHEDAYKSALAEYQEKVKAEETERRRALQTLLKTFLDETKDMPWGAKLVLREGAQHFADETLEGKPQWWKLCFRAGKDPVEAGRAEAARWLKEL